MATLSTIRGAINEARKKAVVRAATSASAHKSAKDIVKSHGHENDDNENQTGKHASWFVPRGAADIDHDKVAHSLGLKKSEHNPNHYAGVHKGHHVTYEAQGPKSAWLATHKTRASASGIDEETLDEAKTNGYQVRNNISGTLHKTFDNLDAALAHATKRHSVTGVGHYVKHYVNGERVGIYRTHTGKKNQLSEETIEEGRPSFDGIKRGDRIHVSLYGHHLYGKTGTIKTANSVESRNSGKVSHVIYTDDTPGVPYRVPTNAVKKIHEEKVGEDEMINEDPKVEHLYTVKHVVRTFRKNEDDNEHFKNAVHLAKHFGTPQEHKTGENHLFAQKNGHFKPEHKKYQDEMYSKYSRKLLAAERNLKEENETFHFPTEEIPDEQISLAEPLDESLKSFKRWYGDSVRDVVKRARETAKSNPKFAKQVAAQPDSPRGSPQDIQRRTMRKHVSEETLDESWGVKVHSFKEFKERAQDHSNYNTRDGHVHFDTHEVGAGGKKWHQTVASIHHLNGNHYQTGHFNHDHGPGSEAGHGQQLYPDKMEEATEVVVEAGNNPHHDAAGAHSKAKMKRAIRRNLNKKSKSE